MNTKTQRDLTDSQFANLEQWLNRVRDDLGMGSLEAITLLNDSSILFQQGVFRRRWYRASDGDPIRRDLLKEPERLHR
jgi:hypothetical protein